MADAGSFIDRLYRTVQGGNLDEIVALFAADCTFIDITQPSAATSRAAVRTIMAETFAGLPDFRPETWTLMVSGDRVAAEVEFSGTHLGSFMGYAATGAEIRWPAASFYTLNRAHDRVLRRVDYYDVGALRRQLAAPAALIQPARPK